MKEVKITKQLTLWGSDITLAMCKRLLTELYVEDRNDIIRALVTYFKVQL